MCAPGLEPKFLLRDIEARVGFVAPTSAPTSLQQPVVSPQIAAVRLAALRHWWQRMNLRMLRKDVPNV